MPRALEIDPTGFRCPANGFSSDNSYLRRATNGAVYEFLMASGETVTVVSNIDNPGGVNEAQYTSFAYNSGTDGLQMKGRNNYYNPILRYTDPATHKVNT